MALKSLLNFTSMVRKIISIMLLTVGIQTYIQAACTPLANPVGTSIWTMIDRLMASSCIGITITQANLPFTASGNNVYSLAEDLIWPGPGAAITIAASVNAFINLGCHSITASDIGIDATAAAARVALYNGMMTSNAAGTILVSGGLVGAREMTFASNVSSAFIDSGDFGIQLSNGPASCTIQDSSFVNIATGIDIVAANVITIKNCQTTNCGRNAISSLVLGSNTVTVDNCKFQGGNTFINLTNAEGWTIQNCTFANGASFGGSFLSFTTSNFIIVKDCTTNRSFGNATNIIQINESSNIEIDNVNIDGSASGGIICSATDNLNITVRNCTLTNIQGTAIALQTTGITGNFLAESNVMLQVVNGIDFTGAVAPFNAFNNTVVGFSGSDYIGVFAGLISTTDADTSTAGYYFRNVSRP